MLDHLQSIPPSTSNFTPPSKIDQYNAAMESLINAMTAFLIADTGTTRDLFAAQVQQAMKAINSLYQQMCNDGNPSDQSFAESVNVQMVFNGQYGILNLPITGVQGTETPLQAAQQSNPNDMKSFLNDLVTTQQFSFFIQELNSAL